MKKINLWLFSAIFICGLAVTMFTSCVDKVDNPSDDVTPGVEEADYTVMLYTSGGGNLDYSIEEDIAKAADVIKRGGLVAFPTETVYGLGGNALDPQAAKAIYAAKGRPSDNPLIVHVARAEDVEAIAASFPDNARRLADAIQEVHGAVSAQEVLSA
jgi:hypothetical protein